MPDISLFLNLCFVLPNPACPSTTFEYKNNPMEVGINGLLTGSMAIEFFKFNQVYK